MEKWKHKILELVHEISFDGLKKCLCCISKSLLPTGCPEAAEYFPFSIFEQTALFKIFRIWFKLHAENTTHFPEVTTAVWAPIQNSTLLCKLESCFQMWDTLENKVSLLSVSFIRTYALYRPQNCNLKRALNTTSIYVDLSLRKILGVSQTFSCKIYKIYTSWLNLIWETSSHRTDMGCRYIYIFFLVADTRPLWPCLLSHVSLVGRCTVTGTGLLEALVQKRS